MPCSKTDAKRQSVDESYVLDSYADCFAAALARRKHAKVVTGDPEFDRFGEEVPVERLP